MYRLATQFLGQHLHSPPQGLSGAPKTQNIRIMTDNEYSKARKAAVDALIYWAKTGMREFTMRDAVNDYLEASGANRPSIGGEQTILAHRKNAANRLAIDCIYNSFCNKITQVSDLDFEVEFIV